MQKKRRTEDCLEMPEGETEETCKEHIKVMKKEMARPSNRSLAMVKELMVLTHAYRREWFLKETIPINQFLEEYPALKTSAEVCRCQQVWFQRQPDYEIFLYMHRNLRLDGIHVFWSIMYYV